MPIVSFNDQSIPAIEVATGSKLLDALLERKVNAKMLCGRRGLCATCHVYADGDISAQNEKEKLATLLLTGAAPNSRLSCQATVQGDVTVKMPEGLFVESLSELEALVGKRASVPILHPVNGTIIVEANKIIVRSMIMKLSDTDFEVRDSAVRS